MPRFAANLTMMFNEVAFPDRFAAAAAAGFKAVECLFPYALTPERLAQTLERDGLTLALFNLAPGDWEAGDRGLASDPARFDALKASVGQGIEYALASGATRLHMMAGFADSRDPVALSAYARAIEHAAGRLADHGLDLLLEPINGRNMPGYFLNDFALAERLILQSGAPNVRLQYDVYHQQILHGDVAMSFRRLLPLVGHVQVASVPSRHEPDGEELNWPFVFEMIDATGYDGFVGCEYVPRTTTEAGLGWFQPWRTR
ncbi:MAG: TIM barrel protein [Amaricoccus sp.]|uniref:2-oxo-tetronate isomerase n=1 Tax=Amaricoccus sp. TaxID=1872485 RepID=UPI0039E5BABB